LRLLIEDQLLILDQRVIVNPDLSDAKLIFFDSLRGLSLPRLAPGTFCHGGPNASTGTRKLQLSQ
jgi:hypothetical protein